MKLRSPVFEDNSTIPREFTCVGDDKSPPFEIDDIPENTRSLALLMYDSDAAQGEWVHWILFDIPVNSRISKGNPQGKQGVNDFNLRSYSGPCPLPGTHHYVFRLFALDAELGFNEKDDIRRKDLEEGIQGRILGKAELTGTYRG
jgi:Raf kinase inhibitor-like YbhB/YbcL family protein